MVSVGSSAPMSATASLLSGQDVKFFAGSGGMAMFRNSVVHCSNALPDLGAVGTERGPGWDPFC